MTNLLDILNIVLKSGLIQEQRLITEIGTIIKISKLDRDAVFKVAVYALLWLVCPVPASDPVKDFHLVGIVTEFVPHDAIHY